MFINFFTNKTNILKKYLLIILLILNIYLINNLEVNADNNPAIINCTGLPWCPNDNAEWAWESIWTAAYEASDKINKTFFWETISNILRKAIEWTWLIAVLALMYWWIIYIISIWNETNTTKAKNIIIYALIWVILSVFAYAIISIVNNLDLNTI